MLLPEGRLPTDEGALKTAKESDLPWGRHLDLPGVDGGQDSPEGLGGCSDGRLRRRTTSWHPTIMGRNGPSRAEWSSVEDRHNRPTHITERTHGDHWPYVGDLGRSTLKPIKA
jgi:hypothetical protein